MSTRQRRRAAVNTSSDRAAWNIIKIALSVTAVSLGVFFAIALLRIFNSASETRRCLDVRRFNVRPDTPAIQPPPSSEPSAFGYFYTNTRQRFIRWRLADDYTALGVDITDINLHGPLTPTEPDVAPVVLDMGTGRNDASHYFRGNATASPRLLVELGNDPGSYYVAFYTGLNTARREIGRDYLNKIC